MGDASKDFQTKLKNFPLWREQCESCSWSIGEWIAHAPPSFPQKNAPKKITPFRRQITPFRRQITPFQNLQFLDLDQQNLQFLIFDPTKIL